MCCSVLDGLNVVDMLLGIWVPHGTHILQSWANIWLVLVVLVGHLLNLPGADIQVSLEEAEGLVGFCAHVVDVLAPYRVPADGKPKYFALLKVSSVCPRSSYWCSRGFLLQVSGSEVHFPGWNWKAMTHLFSHSVSWLRSRSWVWSSGQVTREYGPIIWDPHNQAHIDQLERIQCQAAHFIVCDYLSREPGCITSMLHKLDLPTLQDWHKQQHLFFFHKVVEGLVVVLAG